MIEESVLDKIASCYQESGGYDDEKRRECQRIAQEHGLEFIGDGANREVLGDENWAYKFSYFDPEKLTSFIDGNGDVHRDSVHGNSHEVDVYQRSQPELQRHLATPHEWSDNRSWVKFRRYDGREVDPDGAYELLEHGGWKCTDVGVLDTGDDPVIIDYEYCVPKESDIDPNQLI